MTIRNWNGSNASFDVAADWSPQGIPGPGDTAVIQSGVVSVNRILPAGLTINLVSTGATRPILVLNDGGGLSRGITLNARNVSFSTVLGTAGQASNAGAVVFYDGGVGSVALSDGPGDVAGHLTNTGGISFAGVVGNITNVDVNPATGLINNGVISVRNGFPISGELTLNAPVAGNGTIRVATTDTLSALMGVSGQNVIMESDTSGGGSTLEINNAAGWSSTVSNFGSTDTIKLSTPVTWDAVNRLSFNGGTQTLFSFSNQGTPIANLLLNGSAYNLSNTSFSGAIVNGVEVTTINTSVPKDVARLSFTDPTNGVVGLETTSAYHDPNVPNLQYSYLWASADGVAMSGSVPNMFIHGGSGDDAIAVTGGGSNVLDGGAGSNFLTGGNGGDGGTDQFFVDGRRGDVTFSTVVNFHVGDTATIFGFVGGLSTSSWEANGGATGYTGATLHSALSGAGTNVNASMTFAGIDMTTASAHFQITAGSNGGEPFLLIKYV